MNNEIYLCRDAVSVIFKIFNKKARGEIFNLGTGKPMKLRNIIEFIKNYLKAGKPQYGSIKLRKDEL